MCTCMSHLKFVEFSIVTPSSFSESTIGKDSWFAVICKGGGFSLAKFICIVCIQCYVVSWCQTQSITLVVLHALWSELFICPLVATVVSSTYFHLWGTLSPWKGRPWDWPWSIAEHYKSVFSSQTYHFSSGHTVSSLTESRLPMGGHCSGLQLSSTCTQQY